MPRYTIAAAALGAILAAGAAHAQTPDALERLLDCRAIADDGERLSCLDAATAALAGEVQTAEARARAEREAKKENFGLTEPVIARNEEEFGAERLANKAKEPEEEADIREIKAGVAKVETAPYGALILTLDNGQEWRQLDSDNTIIRIPSNKDVTVTIKKSRFGSYRLTVDQLRRTITVRRTQ